MIGERPPNLVNDVPMTCVMASALLLVEQSIINIRLF